MEAVNKAISLLLLACAVTLAAAESQNFLNTAILELPPKYFADTPRSERLKMLSQLSDWESDSRLDYCNGWLHWHSDSEDALSTSMIYLKLLPRQNETPLVFIHMPKPFADGSPPRKNQTFVLERVNQSWRDVTNSILPKEVDLMMHFRPRRAAAVIEVAPYERRTRNDRRGSYYGFGRRQLDLAWNGSSFDIRQADSPELSNDD